MSLLPEQSPFLLRTDLFFSIVPVVYQHLPFTTTSLSIHYMRVDLDDDCVIYNMAVDIGVIMTSRKVRQQSMKLVHSTEVICMENKNVEMNSKEELRKTLIRTTIVFCTAAGAVLGIVAYNLNWLPF